MKRAHTGDKSDRGLALRCFKVKFYAIKSNLHLLANYLGTLVYSFNSCRVTLKGNFYSSRDIFKLRWKTSPTPRFALNSFLSSGRFCLAALKSDFSFVDVYRKFNPCGRCFFEKLLLSSVSQFQWCSNNVLPFVFSDNSFVLLWLSLNVFPHLRSCIWKFKTRMLSDSSSQALITRLINQPKLKTAAFPTLGAS